MSEIDDLEGALRATEAGLAASEKRVAALSAEVERQARARETERRDAEVTLAEVTRTRDRWFTVAQERSKERDTARAEAARLRAALEKARNAYVEMRDAALDAWAKVTAQPADDHERGRDE